MPAVLSEKAEDILLDLPPDVADDPLIQRVVDAGAREMERLQEFLATLAEQSRPQNATDDNRLLGLWEAFLGLPVEPEGVSLETRRTTVLAAVRRRYAGAGAGWVELATLIIGGVWSHEENSPGAYQLTITIPTLEGYRAGQLLALLGQITPAHIQLFLSDGEGFIVGVDTLGDTL